MGHHRPTPTSAQHLFVGRDLLAQHGGASHHVHRSGPPPSHVMNVDHGTAGATSHRGPSVFATAGNNRWDVVTAAVKTGQQQQQRRDVDDTVCYSNNNSQDQQQQVMVEDGQGVRCTTGSGTGTGTGRDSSGTDTVTTSGTATTTNTTTTTTTTTGHVDDRQGQREMQKMQIQAHRPPVSDSIFGGRKRQRTGWGSEVKID